MPRERRVSIVFAIAVVMGVGLALIKGDSGGIRGAVGNLSAPWLLIGIYAGFSVRTAGRAMVTGVAATVVALGAFYVTLTGVLAGHLGGGGFAREVAVELNANRVYLLFGVFCGPVAGAVGWWLRRRQASLLLATG
jgi:hypothetical protein